MTRLQGKQCVVTGAAQGIGLAITDHFLREGADVILTDINAERGESEAKRRNIRFLKLDVQSEDDWATLAGEAPKIDVLVNNAGVTGFEEAARPHDPEHATLDD